MRILQLVLILALPLSSYGLDLETSNYAQMKSLYMSYIKRTCSLEDCIDHKAAKFEKCESRTCRINYINFEESIIAKCESSNNKEGCHSQKNFKAAMCVSGECVSDLAKSYSKGISPYKIRKYRPRKKVSRASIFKSDSSRLSGQSSNSLVTKSKEPLDRLHIDSSDTPAKADIDPVRKDALDIQDELMLKTKQAYTNNCQTLECLKKVEKTFEKLLGGKTFTNAPKPSLESLTSIESLSKYPKEMIQIYLNEGAFSDSMISYFKANTQSLGVDSSKALPVNCNNYLNDQECSIAKTKAFWFRQISSYFHYTGEGTQLAKHIYKTGYRTDYSVLCSTYFDDLPQGDRPLTDFFSASSQNRARGYNPSYRTGLTQEKCLLKFSEVEKKYLEKLKELGDFPSERNYSFHDPGSLIQGTRYPSFIGGKCHYFIYTPTKDKDIPSLSWFLDKSNKRVKRGESFENRNKNECDFLANQHLYKLNPNVWEEYIFFKGNVPAYKMSSKVLPYRNGFETNTKFYSNTVASRPECIIRTSRQSSFVAYDVRKVNLSVDGSCEKPCRQAIERYGKNAKKRELQCFLKPNIIGNNMFNYEGLIYDSINKLKKCEYFDLHWSKRPIRTHLVKDELECLRAGAWHRDEVNSPNDLINDYRLGNDSFSSLKIVYDGKEILKYAPSFKCSMSHLRGNVGKYIKAKEVIVKSKQQCFKSCMDYKSSIVPHIRESGVFVKCNVGKRNYMLNFSEATTYDPFTAVKSGDEFSAEYYFNKVFQDVWHGYPYIN